MPSKNDITGDEIKSKGSSDLYRDGWDRIFGKKKEPKEDEAFLEANEATLEKIIQDIPDSDPVGKQSMKGQLEKIKQKRKPKK